jgi:hypothetical protein
MDPLMLRSVGLALALWLSVGCGNALAQRPSFGPLTFEEGAPINRMSYTPMMESADVAPAGSLEASLYLGLSNMFEHDSSATHFIFVDMERLITAPSVRWGLAEDLELGGRLTFETRSGGFLDGPVRWYHNLLGFGQANRDVFPEEGYRYELGDGSGTTYIEVAPKWLVLEDVRLWGKWRALRSSDGRSVLSLKGVVRVPTSENVVGEERTDVGLMALGRLGVGAWYLHGMMGASTVRAAPAIGPMLVDPSVFFSFAVERSLGSSVAGIFQYQLSTPALRGYDDRELDWPLSDVIFGVAGAFGEGWGWNVSFQEDLPADAPAIDFTVGAAISRSW